MAKDDAALTWKRVKTPDGTDEHHMFVGEQHIAMVFNEGDSSDPSWVVRNIVDDTEDTGYPTLGDARDSAECLAEEEMFYVSPEAALPFMAPKGKS